MHYTNTPTCKTEKPAKMHIIVHVTVGMIKSY